MIYREKKIVRANLCVFATKHRNLEGLGTLENTQV